MVMTMQAVGIVIETHHHEVASAGQAEIDMKYDTLVKMADQVLWYKHIVKNVARQAGKTATFMPKPLFGDNGSGMHTHQSLWKSGKPLFAGDGYAGMSEMALFYIGGLLKHAAAICAFANPTTNSYRRLVPGYEAPVNLAYSARNRSASIRIPMYSSSPKAKRLELRSPDPSCNPYLAFAAMMMAGLDGIENRIHPGDPLDKDIYSLSPEELAEVPHVPGSLDAALDALHKDRAFLMKGDVFSNDLIDAWIAYKTRGRGGSRAAAPGSGRVPAVLRLLGGLSVPSVACNCRGHPGRIGFRAPAWNPRLPCMAPSLRMGARARLPARVCARPAYRAFARATGADLGEAELPLGTYPSLGDLFARRLRSGCAHDRSSSRCADRAV